MGVLFLIIGYAIWKLKWWAFPLGLVVQGMVIAVASIGIIRWLALGQQAPVVWDGPGIRSIQPDVGPLP